MNRHRFWALTCYFNPARFRRKLPNYRVFRERLDVPLLTVEFSRTGTFELRPQDADILVQVRDGDVMWQKERLLNLAFDRLPGECEFVAWLDCDIVFERRDWARAAIRNLERNTLCQPFRTIHQLRPGTTPEAICPDSAYDSHESAGHAIAAGVEFSVPHSARGVANPYRRGHAWCARRELIARHGLYDGSVLGGGDNMFVFAITGQAEALIGRGNISPAHASHYREWACRFLGAGPRIATVQGDIFHLWHGALSKRRYFERGGILCAAGYDPSSDIALSPEGCWRWSSDKREMHRRVNEYFEQRDEDEEALPQPG